MKPGLKNPFNLIVTGVGGQGNVLASRILGNMLALGGFQITIGETFGASQRGGSVMSHIRISPGSTWSPQIPKGCADAIVALEPAEGVRVLSDYGHDKVCFISNTRPVYPAGVIAGGAVYPPIEEIRSGVLSLVPDALFIDATEEAIKLGRPILGNIVMIGALAATRLLPLDRKKFRVAADKIAGSDSLDYNLKAFDAGRRLFQTAMSRRSRPAYPVTRRS
ncbi:MAG: indolepyruvate oxidoreductase subunit beta [Syntrophales bacterium]